MIIRILFLCLLLTGCYENPVTVQPKPELKIVDLYGNDAIDATVEYTIDGKFDSTYLIVDESRIEVYGKGNTFTGYFPIGAKERKVVVEYDEKKLFKSF